MSLITVNTGTYNDMFDDLNAAMGTTLGWTENATHDAE